VNSSDVGGKKGTVGTEVGWRRLVSSFAPVTKIRSKSAKCRFVRSGEEEERKKKKKKKKQLSLSLSRVFVRPITVVHSVHKTEQSQVRTAAVKMRWMHATVAPDTFDRNFTTEKRNRT